LAGQHPQSPAEIGTWFEQTAQAWNHQPTPFVWHGKRRQRRRRQRGDAYAVGGSAHARRSPCQVARATIINGIFRGK